MSTTDRASPNSMSAQALPDPRGFPGAMAIRRATSADRSGLVDIWLRSVQATHAFLTPHDIDELVGPTSAYLTSDAPELWVVTDASDEPVGFMGLADNEVDSLFLAPEVHRRGVGRSLIAHAAALRGELTVLVNEQNEGAVRFYESCGFTVDGRSDVDDDGRPFPILSMRRPADPLDGAVAIRRS
jgi:putative acetyltransferase